MRPLSLLLLTLLCLTSACDDESPDENIITPKTLDCVSGNCDEFIPGGDAYYEYPNGERGVFSGMADPCLRSDPETGRLWLTYTWQTMHPVGDEFVPGTDVHYAHSDDGGNTWEFDDKLWTSMPASTMLEGKETMGYVDYEVSNVLPVVTTTGTRWYGARIEYFLPDEGGYGARPITSFKVAILEASSLAGLKDAVPDIAGTRHTTADWNIRFRFNDLSSEVAHVDIWNEPALYYADDRLFLVMRGLTFDAAVPDYELSNIYVFSAVTDGPVNTLTWGYEGQLAGQAEAAELGGSSLTQIEIAEGQDGRLLALLTPEAWSTEEADFVHLGCTVVEIERLSDPSLARYETTNALKIRAIVTASDQGALGPGAAAYDPDSATGMLFVKRTLSTGIFRASMWETKLHP